MTLQPADHKSLSNAAAEQIRAAIDSGELQPGDRLVERRLAAELGISHIPIREALGRLEDEGVVTRTPRRGARVAELSARDLDEIASLRISLEELAVERVMRRDADELVGALNGIVAAMTEAAAAGDADGFLELDREFHERLWELADHQLLLDLASQIRLRVNRFLRIATLELSEAALVDQADEHARIVKALTGGDVAQARAEMRGHIERAHARIRAGADDSAQAGA